jgi:dephospho-CoA kinase
MLVGRWKDKYVIGLTGNIATGKSLVRRMLEHLGAYTIDADSMARQVMDPSAPAYKPVIEMFGKFVVGADGQIDRNRLGAIVFAHADALRELEKITHPIISSAIDTLIGRARHRVVVVEAIKLLESDLVNLVDSIWVVDATPDNQLRRLREKRNMSEGEARKRITVQNPQSEKIARANVVIQNNGTPEQTWGQVQAAWSKIGYSEESTQAVQAVRHVAVEPPSAPAHQAPSVPAAVAQPSVATLPSQPAMAPQEVSSITIKRPRPADFDKIANLINRVNGSNLTRDDIMAGFTERTYLLAEGNEQALGVISFVVENLVTRVDGFVISPAAPLEAVGKALIEDMESASADLQSEIAFVFLPRGRDQEKAVFLAQGYAETDPTGVRYPAWREAVNEARKGNENTDLLSKRLRESLVLKPI